MSSAKLLVMNAFIVPVFAGTILLSPNADTARIAITAHRVRVRIVYLLFHHFGLQVGRLYCRIARHS
jgi:hypothetical protein